MKESVYPTQGTSTLYNDYDDDDEEDDENETDTEIVVPLNPPPAQKKKKLKAIKENKITNLIPREKDITIIHPTATTLIYRPSTTNLVQLQQSTLFTNTSSQQQRHIDISTGATSSYFITGSSDHNPRPNIIHHHPIQIQIATSGTHQFGNQAIYTTHPINMTSNNPSSGSDAASAFDFINSFNLT
jgi:hypothetical protein